MRFRQWGQGRGRLRTAQAAKQVKAGDSLIRDLLAKVRISAGVRLGEPGG